MPNIPRRPRVAPLTSHPQYEPAPAKPEPAPAPEIKPQDFSRVRKIIPERTLTPEKSLWEPEFTIAQLMAKMFPNGPRR